MNTSVDETPAPNSARWLVGLLPTDLVVLAVLSLVSVAPFGRLFVGSRAFLVSLAVTVAVVVVARATANRPPWIAWSGYLVVLFLALAAVLRVGLPTPGAIGEAWDEATSSWADLLTATIPTVPTGQLLVVPLVTVWAAAAASMELGQRTRWISAPAIPPVLALALSLGFAGARQSTSMAVGVAFVAVMLAAMLLRARPSRRTSDATIPATDSPGRHHDQPGHLRTGALAVGCVAVLGLGAVSISPVDGRDRYDLKSEYQPPIDPRAAVTPLAQIRPGLNDTSGEPAFTVQFSELPGGVSIDRIPIARLESFDGVVFGTNADFARAGSQLPPSSSGVEDGPTVTATYTIGPRYFTPFLPVFGRPLELDTTSVLGFDRVAGMLITGQQDPTGESYIVTARVDPTGSTVRDEVPAATRFGLDPEFATLSLPPRSGWPAEITAAAADLAPGAPRDPAALMQLADAMRSDDFGYDTAARPGHNLARIVDLVTAPTGGEDLATGRIGYDEQFASAFAALARVKEFPARVVVGYLVDPEEIASGARVPVFPTSLAAWVEVHVNGVGWVGIDPTSRVPREPPPPQEEVVAAEEETETTTPPTTVPRAVPVDGPGDDDASGRSVPWWALVLVVPAAPIATVLAKRLRRRRRLNADSESERTLGAWREVRDRLRERGVRPPPHATVSEVVATCPGSGEGATTDGILELVPLVDRALYAPSEPGAEIANAAWSTEQEVSAALRSEETFVAKVRHLVDPRPLIPSTGERRGFQVKSLVEAE